MAWGATIANGIGTSLFHDAQPLLGVLQDPVASVDCSNATGCRFCCISVLEPPQ